MDDGGAMERADSKTHKFVVVHETGEYWSGITEEDALKQMPRSARRRQCHCFRIPDENEFHGVEAFQILTMGPGLRNEKLW